MLIEILLARHLLCRLCGRGATRCSAFERQQGVSPVLSLEHCLHPLLSAPSLQILLLFWHQCDLRNSWMGCDAMVGGEGGGGGRRKWEDAHGSAGFCNVRLRAQPSMLAQ